MRQFVAILISVVLFVSCSSRQEKVMRMKIEKMKSENVRIPFDKMQCWLGDSVQQDCPWETAKMKLIVFVDSNSCSVCKLKKMHVWKDFVDLEQKYDNQFYVYFIFQVHQTGVGGLLSLFKETDLHHSLYVDSCGAFSKENPQIPIEDKYHVFLLDDKNRVVLVGDPTFNERLEKMLREKLEQELNA